MRASCSTGRRTSPRSSTDTSTSMKWTVLLPVHLHQLLLLGIVLTLFSGSGRSNGNGSRAVAAFLHPHDQTAASKCFTRGRATSQLTIVRSKSSINTGTVLGASDMDTSDSGPGPGGPGRDPCTLAELPIFPLRKFPRLPTDCLTLNLYEERYLAMAESIIASSSTTATAAAADSPLFGALFVATKPQIVTDGGRGPVVPLVETQDVGTLFAVRDYEEDWVPTVGNLILRRRIKLNAVGVARFRIDSIINDGTGTKNSTRTGKQLPYILVNATLLSDDSSSPAQRVGEEDEYQALCKMLQEFNPEKEGRFANPFSLFGRLSTTDSKVATATEPLVEFAQVYAAIRDITTPGESLQPPPPSSPSSSSKNYQDSNYQELFSFYAASRLLSAKEAPRTLVPLLELESTQERIRRLLQLKNQNG